MIGLLLAAAALGGYTPDPAHENRPEIRLRIVQQELQRQERRLDEAIRWALRVQRDLRAERAANAALEEPPPGVAGVAEPEVGGSSSSVGGSSWAAGAPLCGASCIQCESGGNPNAVSPDGTYWGLYQYDLTSWIADGGSASSYGSASAAEQHRVAANAPFDRWPNC